MFPRGSRKRSAEYALHVFERHVVPSALLGAQIGLERVVLRHGIQPEFNRALLGHYGDDVNAAL
jgi:hypothetical protein